jgi:transcriptional regulator with XRE-family HTH domain
MVEAVAVMSTLSLSAPRDAGRLIRLWRRRVGLTQEGLAGALSVTFSTVSRWENGHVQPSKLAWRAITQLAAERNCPLDHPDDGDGVTAGEDRPRAQPRMAAVTDDA